MQPTDQPWQTGLPNIKNRISYLRSSEKWADLIINFPKHEKSIKAHKLLLALSSPVFEAMLFGPLAEGEVVSLPDDPPEAFEWLLDHLYCVQRDLPSMEMAIEVFSLAHKYHIPELCRICSEYLCKKVNVKNLLLLYRIGYTFQDNSLLKHCEKILPTESDKILQSNEVSKLPRSTLAHLLENKKLRPSSALIVFKCIHTWGKAELGRLTSSCSDVEGRIETTGESWREGGMSSSPHSLRQCVERLLPSMNFSGLSVDEFFEHVLSTGIFTPKENISILQAIKGDPGTVLPSCVRPWTMKSIVLINRKAKDSCVLSIIHPIILHHIELHFIKSEPEGQVFTCYDGDMVIGSGIFSGTRCMLQKPINLEAGRDYIIIVKGEIECNLRISINEESGRITYGGSWSVSIEKLLLNFSVLK